MYPKWNPGKWKHGLKRAVPWWLNFDPYSNRRRIERNRVRQLEVVPTARNWKEEVEAIVASRSLNNAAAQS